MKFIVVITAWHVNLVASIVKEIEASSEIEALGMAHKISVSGVDQFYKRHIELIPIASCESIKRTQLTIKERLTGVANI